MLPAAVPAYAVAPSGSVPVATARMRAEARGADMEEMAWGSTGKKKRRWLGAVIIMAAFGGVAVAATRTSWFPGASGFAASVFGTPTVHPSGDATITATAKQTGVRLRLDGEPVGILPVTLKNVTPGEHVLEFSIDNHYSTERQRVAVGPNEVREVAPVSLKVIRGAATFNVRTEGATLTLVSGDERRVISDPLRPVEIDTDRPAAVEVSKPGHVLVRQPLTFEGAAEKLFVVDVGPADAAHPVADRTREATASAALATRSVVSRAEWQPRPRQAASPEAAPIAHAPKPEPQGRPEAAQENCIVNFNSIPSSNLGLDGRPLGSTPKVGVSVPPGRHSVVFANADGSKRLSFSCTGGSTKTVAVRLNE